MHKVLDPENWMETRILIKKINPTCRLYYLIGSI